MSVGEINLGQYVGRPMQVDGKQRESALQKSPVEKN